MRRYVVGGNWKSNGTMKFAREFPKDVLNKLSYNPNKVEVIAAPTALHLSTVQANTENNVHVATQNLSLTGNGAYTGEISIDMIKEAGIKYTLTGHSERRSLYGETDQDVGMKTKIALDNGLTVLACIGEYLEEREAGKTNDVNSR